MGSLELDFIFYIPLLDKACARKEMILRSFHLETSALQFHVSQRIFQFPVSKTSVKTVQPVFLTLAVPVLTAGL
jgi:hypothetical protein